MVYILRIRRLFREYLMTFSGIHHLAVKVKLIPPTVLLHGRNGVGVSLPRPSHFLVIPHLCMIFIVVVCVAWGRFQFQEVG